MGQQLSASTDGDHVRRITCGSDTSGLTRVDSGFSLHVNIDGRTMFTGDHPPPHVHAMYAGHEAVIEWASEHRDELMEDWRLCEQMQQPKRIAPLK
jgi:hypothetical protein